MSISARGFSPWNQLHWLYQTRMKYSNYSGALSRPHDDTHLFKLLSSEADEIVQHHQLYNHLVPALMNILVAKRRPRLMKYIPKSSHKTTNPLVQSIQNWGFKMEGDNAWVFLERNHGRGPSLMMSFDCTPSALALAKDLRQPCKQIGYWTTYPKNNNNHKCNLLWCLMHGRPGIRRVQTTSSPL